MYFLKIITSVDLPQITKSRGYFPRNAPEQRDKCPKGTLASTVSGLIAITVLAVVVFVVVFTASSSDDSDNRDQVIFVMLLETAYLFYNKLGKHKLPIQYSRLN